jgi:uncharacterized protein YcfJ
MFCARRGLAGENIYRKVEKVRKYDKTYFTSSTFSTLRLNKEAVSCAGLHESTPDMQNKPPVICIAIWRNLWT